MKPQPTTQPRALSLPALERIGHGHETNYNYTMAEHAREEYLRLYTLWQQLERLKIAGIHELTLKAHTGTVTIPVDEAGSICMDLAEQVGQRLSKLETDILRHEEDSQKEEADERHGLGSRPEVFAFCLPLRPMSDAEFAALPPQARRAFDEQRADELAAA